MSGIIGTGGKSGVIGTGSREGWVLLETQSVSNGSEKTIGSTSTITSKYDEYMFVGESIRLHSASSLIFQFITGGSTRTSAYKTVAHGCDSAATITNVTSGNYNFGFINSGSSINNNAHNVTQFQGYLNSPLVTSHEHIFYGTAAYSTNLGYCRNSEFSTRHDTQGVFSAIKFYAQSGNITGTFKLYGLSK